MFKRLIRNTFRRPLYSIAVILFAGVLSAVLCYLYWAGEEELRSFEETYASVPVFFKVVDLDGSKPKDYKGINGWVKDLFDDDWMKPQLLQYIRETHVRVSFVGATYFITDDDGIPVMTKLNTQETTPMTVTGVSSTYVAEELTEDWGGKIYWQEGYDESILSSDEFVCIVPENLKNRPFMEFEFVYSYNPSGVMGHAVKKEIKRTFQVIGYFTDPGNNHIYCPYPTMEYVHAYLSKSKKIENIGAILNDNTKLEQFKEDAGKWFAEPNPKGEKTPWGRYDYEYYLFALDIDDTMLHNLEANMKSSMRLNQLASAVVFALSAGAGFLTGFLVIRSRKREIALMRTMGASQVAIFTELALEQMLCVAAGILIGGGFFLWKPETNLALFAGIYFIGLAFALIIFLWKNLLTTIKEDE